MKIITQADVKNKIVLLRTDYNVTIAPDGKIIDDIRIRATLPTIKYLLKQQVKRIIIVTHLGRPIVRPNASMPSIIQGNQGLILEPVAKDLAKRLKIKFKDFTTKYQKNFILPFYQLSDQFWVMENVRFVAGEEKNDLNFAKNLASLAQVYVDDAFGNAHRTHASMVGVTSFLPSYAGLLMESEVKNLTMLAKKPQKPFVLIMGGAKVSEKIKALQKLTKKADKILLGGVMAHTFLASRNVDIKHSSVDKDSIDLADDLYSQYASKFYLPTDLVWRGSTSVDIGKTTIGQYEKIISKAKTIFYNGTMGLTSMGNFKYALGTWGIIKAIAASDATNKIVCGGDTIAEVDKLKLMNKMTFISTGGGAALAFLAGEKMPGIEALEKSEK